MSNAHYPHGLCFLVKLINDPVISNPNAPIAFGPSDLAAPDGSRVLGQRLDLARDSVKLPSLEPLEVSLRASFKEDLIHVGCTLSGSPLSA